MSAFDAAQGGTPGSDLSGRAIAAAAAAGAAGDDAATAMAMET